MDGWGLIDCLDLVGCCCGFVGRFEVESCMRWVVLCSCVAACVCILGCVLVWFCHLVVFVFVFCGS